MKLLIYVIFRITILLNKITPFWVIYRVSDLIYYFFYYVFPYRKKVVLANLNKAFPEKSEKERVNLSKKCSLYKLGMGSTRYGISDKT